MERFTVVYQNEVYKLCPYFPKSGIIYHVVWFTIMEQGGYFIEKESHTRDV